MGMIGDLLGAAFLYVSREIENGNIRFGQKSANKAFWGKSDGKSDSRDFEERRRKREEARQTDLANQIVLVRNYTDNESTIFIDSNVWMNESYHSSISRFCKLFTEHKAPFKFHGE